MSSGISGNYDGEGSNVAGGAGNAAPVAPSLDVASRGLGSETASITQSGQGKTTMIAADRRSRLRVSSEGARTATAISYGGGNQILTKYARGVYITTGGALNLVLVDDPNATGNVFTGLVAGQWYPFCVAQVLQSSSTAAGFLLF
jgi:hypothetical protein